MVIVLLSVVSMGVDHAAELFMKNIYLKKKNGKNSLMKIKQFKLTLIHYFLIRESFE